jgi:hypothetical protein
MRDLIFHIAYWLIVAGGIGFFATLAFCWLCGLVALVRRRRLSDAFIRRGMNTGRAFGLLIFFAVVIALVGGWLVP